MISIIIPAYNEEKYIGRCLWAIQNLKGASDYEVIVVNNASTDNTVSVVRNIMPEVFVLDEPRKGLTRAYNCGAKAAKGDILVFVDSDVILPEDHLEKVSQEFEKDPKLVALSGPYIYKDGGILCYLAPLFLYLFLVMPSEILLNRFLNLGVGVISGNSAIRKDIFEKIGGFNEELFYGLDADLALRIRRLGRVRFKYGFSVESSARRLRKEGTMRMIVRYALNLLWPAFFGRPLTKDYIDVR